MISAQFSGGVSVNGRADGKGQLQTKAVQGGSAILMLRAGFGGGRGDGGRCMGYADGRAGFVLFWPPGTAGAIRLNAAKLQQLGVIELTRMSSRQ